MSSDSSSSASSTSPVDLTKKARGRPQLDLHVVHDSNAAQRAQGGDEEETQAAAVLKHKRIDQSKRKTMPEKLHIDQSLLNQHATQAQSTQEDNKQT